MSYYNNIYGQVTFDKTKAYIFDKNHVDYDEEIESMDNEFNFDEINNGLLSINFQESKGYHWLDDLLIKLIKENANPTGSYVVQNSDYINEFTIFKVGGDKIEYQRMIWEFEDGNMVLKTAKTYVKHYK